MTCRNHVRDDYNGLKLKMPEYYQKFFFNVCLAMCDHSFHVYIIQVWLYSVFLGELIVIIIQKE